MTNLIKFALMVNGKRYETNAWELMKAVVSHEVSAQYSIVEPYLLLSLCFAPDRAIILTCNNFCDQRSVHDRVRRE